MQLVRRVELLMKLHLMSLAIWDHTSHLTQVNTPHRNVGTRFMYPREMEG